MSRSVALPARLSGTLAGLRSPEAMPAGCGAITTGGTKMLTDLSGVPASR